MKQETLRQLRSDIQSGGAAQLHLTAEGQDYTRIFRPKERLILLGGGHVGKALCHFAAELDFSVTVVDDRLEFSGKDRFPEAKATLCEDFPIAIARLNLTEHDMVAVITRGHSSDGVCLRAILSGTMPRYLGMIGSRRRVAGLLRLLEEEGFSKERLQAVNAPIGLPIGALTVDEIAISILAQLIQYRRSGTKRSGGGILLVNEEAELPLLDFLCRSKKGRCLITVYETAGSTPAKSGAMMALDEDGNTAGTIGGGCGESAVLEEAAFLIGTGKSRVMTLDMTNEVAAGAGMVCGGWMKVLIEDVTE